MKIKNISKENLNLSIIKNNGEKLILNLKPTQVTYVEDAVQVNKQLLVYEKKRIITIFSNIEKPDYVDFYKVFFEAGTMPNAKIENTIHIDLIDEDEEDDDDVVSEIEFSSALENLEEADDSSFIKSEPKENASPKKGRGRPKKEVIETTGEKRGKGRPKGSFKVKTIDENVNTEPKKRGRPFGTFRKVVVAKEPKQRGRPRNNPPSLNLQSEVGQQPMYC